MPRLVLINGPPGIGKSTIAGLYADRHPGTLNLDIDRVRALIGGWPDDFVAAGEIVRPLALQMAVGHLAEGRDVIVPQYLADPNEVASFAEVAQQQSAAFAEVVLVDTVASSTQRFIAGVDWSDPVRCAVVDVVQRSGGEAFLAALYDELMTSVDGRPAVRIDSIDGDVEGTYQLLCGAIDQSTSPQPSAD